MFVVCVSLGTAVAGTHIRQLVHLITEHVKPLPRESSTGVHVDLIAA